MHSLTDGQLGCVHLPAVVNSTAMNIGAQGFGSLFSILWGRSPGMEMLRCLYHAHQQPEDTYMEGPSAPLHVLFPLPGNHLLWLPLIFLTWRKRAAP